MWKPTKESADAAVAAGDLFVVALNTQGGSKHPGLQIPAALFRDIFEAGWAAHEQHLRRQEMEIHAQAFIRDMEASGCTVPEWSVDADGTLRYQVIMRPPLEKVHVLKVKATVDPRAKFMIPKTGVYRTVSGERAEVTSVSDIAIGFIAKKDGAVTGRWSLTTGHSLMPDLHGDDIRGPWTSEASLA